MQLSSIAVFILAILVLAVFSLAVYSLISWLKSMQRSLDETRTTINNSLFDNTRQLNESLGRTTQDIYNRLTVAAGAINDLKKEAGAFAEVSRSMKDLHDFLKSPKLRGNIGESVLSDLLAQIFPKSSYQLQYSFRSGEKVDAIIKTDAGLLPIDSKFPMENFQKMSEGTNKDSEAIYRKAFSKDIKKHLLDISQKYILPAEKTLDFALMYIPSESVYYELAIDSALMDYARSLRVYPVSPNTMYATLQTILLSFEGRKIEQKAKDVFVMLRSLQKDYEKTNVTLQVLGGHLKSAYNKYGEVQEKLGQIGQKLDQTNLLEP